ncbi:phosphotransferase enzyme family protein [Bianquea renquensis]|jgi:phosphotransferase|uniref:Phosphotransferase n=1 Tax=Bianquea renquensis TaxID=2763661 RepID=A0A926DX76_9FIRM|nr:phosphotransferase [Bianquea renquensis]MBC8545084.1 phosphotransferase [Bianquea renquensis]
MKTMDWLYYLKRQNLSVSLPLKTLQGKFATCVENEGETYILSAFEKADGQNWDKKDPQRWNAAVFNHWGRFMGDMHCKTKSYTPANNIDIRHSFTGREALGDSIRNCPPVNKIAEDLIAQMLSLPKTKDSYGLIHYDLHPWNFFIEKDHINAFDFDDSLYGWFSLDIGIALYHGLWWGRKDDSGTDYTNSLIGNFLDGYLSANPLSDYWLDKIPMFMKFRKICQFSWFYSPHNTDDLHNLLDCMEQDRLFADCSIDKQLFTNRFYQSANFAAQHHIAVYS